MSRILNISDQQVLDNILDVIEPHKQSEAVAYLQSIYGADNLEEYCEIDKDEYLDLFNEKEVADYFGDDLLSEFDDETLYNWVDRSWLLKNVDLQDIVSSRKPIDVLDCLYDVQIVKYLELKGYKVSEI